MRCCFLVCLGFLAIALAELEFHRDSHNEFHCTVDIGEYTGQEWRRCEAEERSAQEAAGKVDKNQHPKCDEQSILIKGGTVVNHDREWRADVLIEHGIITKVSPNITDVPQGTRTIDATGKLIMPGGIDPHTHLDMPFMGQVTADDFFTGQAAAVAGGTTMHIDFALPVDGDIMEGYKTWRRKAQRSCTDYAFHMAISTWNDKVSEDMKTLVNKEGVNSFKFFMAYKGALMVDDTQLAAGMSRCKALGALPMVHAENGDLVVIGQKKMIDLGITGPEGHPLSRPTEVEAEATGRAIRMAKVLQAPLYVVHVMSKDAMEEVERARVRGQRVFGEPVASALAKDESELWSKNWTWAAAHVMSPPIRKLAVDGAALKNALARGVLQLVATDHAVFRSDQKAMGRHDFRIIPNGVNGLEERLHVVWETMVNTGLISHSEFVRITSSAAAQIFNLYPQKGAILEGSDADLIIFDPARKHVITHATDHSRCDLNIYEGMEITGYVETTISQGCVVWENGQLRVRPGAGRYIKAKPFSPVVYDGLHRANALEEKNYKPVARE